MSPKPRTGPPLHLSALNQLIRNQAAARTMPELRVRATMANTIVGQMLPSGVVKGGTAMSLRRGGDGARFSTDLDVTRASGVDPDVHVEELRANLAAGWHGFTGRLVTKPPATPAGVPGEYVMTPFEVKLAYKGRSWLTVVLEIGHEEIGSFAMSSRVIAADVVEMFVAVGLPTPNAIPVLAVEHQIAQKLHACSAPRSDRAHDLVDLQLLAREDGLDLVVIQQTVRRLFVARNGHSWPPVISVGEGWVGRYAEAAAGLDVISRVDDAIGWANAFIADISGT